MQKKKVLILSPLPEDAARAMMDLKASPEEIQTFSIVTYAGTTREDLLEAVQDACVIVGDYTNNLHMDADVIAAARQCIFIQQPTTGYQHIDVDAAARHGVCVANIAGANTVAVAEHSLMLALACLKKLAKAHEKTRSGAWAQDEMSLYGVYELYGKTVGILGMGRIGKEVARRAGVFGCNLLYHDVVRLPPEEEREFGIAYKALDEMLPLADVLTIHIPSAPENDGLLDAARLGCMKRSAIIINASRGAIIDEAALAAALREGRLGGAGLDVFCTEPISPECPLLDAPNVILTPHIAGATNESRARIIDLTIDNVIRVLRGQEPVNIVNGVKPRI